MLQVENLGVRYGTATILREVSFALEEGWWLMVVGLNGAGKSTLLGAVAQSVPHSGSIRFRGEELAAMRGARRARCLGVLAQSHQVGYAFTVEEVVRLGRYAYATGLLKPPGEEDEAAVEQALALTGMADKREQSVLTLSGGELQRTFLAQLLAQNPELLLLDEPANHLDLPYQKHVFGLIQQWRQAGGRGVLSVVHDLSLAKAYGTHALLLDQGRVRAFGPIHEVLSSDTLEAVYQMDVSGWMQGLLSQWQ